MNESMATAGHQRIARVLLGASDSPAGLLAARLAVTLASACGAKIRAVHVVSDGEVSVALASASLEARTGGPAVLAERREHDASAVLQHIARLAGRCQVPVETVLTWGELASCLLAEADRWSADLIVLGRGGALGGHHPGNLGAEVRRVLEFAEQPVVVVPPG